MIPYSYGRKWVVAALAATDPAVPRGVAVECLWDCEPEIRELAAGIADRRQPSAARRLAELGLYNA